MVETVLPFTNGFYVSDSLPVSAQRCVNWYPVPSQAPSLVPDVLFGTPGIRQISEAVNQKSNRGGHVMDGIPYLVQADKLYRLTSAFAMEEIGDIEGSIRVSMADNGVQLLILVPGGKGYIYNHVTDVFGEITDVDFRANGDPQYAVFIDSFFVCTTDEKKFIKSAPNDGLDWNALDFGTAESDPDGIVAPLVFKNQLYITGEVTADAFQNIGGADFPFQRTGLFLSKGVYAPNSLINTQDSFMFVGGGENESPAVWVCAGASVQKVSTNAIDTLLQSLTSDQVSGIYAWTYAQKGAYFVGFALPDTTIVYDVTSQKWHERQSYVNSILSAYRVSVILTAYGKAICADVYDGRIGILDADFYKEYISSIVRVFITQPFQNNMKSMFVPWIELTVESGVGNADSPDPVISMQRSADGKTYTDSIARELGKVGQFNRRVRWYRNGRVPRFESFKFTLSDAVKPVAIQLTAQINGGAK